MLWQLMSVHLDQVNRLASTLIRTHAFVSPPLLDPNSRSFSFNMCTTNNIGLEDIPVQEGKQIKKLVYGLLNFFHSKP